jgi:hypothetical protein
MNGIEPQAAVQLLTAADGVPVPETPDQREWMDQYAKKSSAATHRRLTIMGEQQPLKYLHADAALSHVKPALKSFLGGS